MKKNQILALLLALALVLGLCACGGSAASSVPADTGPEAASEAPAEEAVDTADEPVTPDEPEEAEEEVAPSEVEEAPEVVTVEYPLDDAYTFSFTAIARNNVLALIGDNDFTITPAYQALAEQTGCTLEFTMLGEATAEEKTNIQLASGDMTDFYTGLGTYGNNLPSAIADGIVFDLVPYLEECAPDYKAVLESDAEMAASAYNPDGTLCRFVSEDAGLVTKGILIRQDWLDKLGKDVPTNREDLEEVLHLFQSEMGATMPLLMNAGLETGLTASFNAVFAGFRGMDFQLTEPNGKEVVANLASENFIEYLLYLNHLYDEGLIIDDFMNTGREYGNWESSYYSGKCGVWSDGHNELSPQNRANADDPNYMLTPMAMSDYECHVSEASTASMNGVVFLTTACDEPEAAIKFMNYAYTEPGRNAALYGIEGESYIINDAGEIELTDLVLNNENGWSVQNALTFYGAPQWFPTLMNVHHYEMICSEESMAGIEYWTEAYGDKSMKIPSGCVLDAEASTEYYNLASDVLTLFSENAVKVVVGALDEAGYRDIIKTAGDMGLTRMTELYQAAYDDYLAKQ
ncbi:MAG: extracellular solute-binding protein [Oscillospiraceae bacterium]|nr:extracellular solute-binding protein [Oscillospiraceae bacterium]